MIIVYATGFVPKKPVLQVVGQQGRHRKLEFRVVDRKRSGTGTRFEATTFVAWDDVAERLAESLQPGSLLTAVGEQETHTWDDPTKGGRQSRTVYRLLSYRFVETRRDEREEREGDGRGDYQGQPRQAQQSGQWDRSNRQGARAPAYRSDAPRNDDGYGGPPPQQYGGDDGNDGRYQQSSQGQPQWGEDGRMS